jgi:hypothetical protein
LPILVSLVVCMNASPFSCALLCNNDRYYVNSIVGGWRCKKPLLMPKFHIGGGNEIGAVVFTTAPYPKAPELPVVRPAIPRSSSGC